MKDYRTIFVHNPCMYCGADRTADDMHDEHCPIAVGQHAAMRSALQPCGHSMREGMVCHPCQLERRVALGKKDA